MLPAGWCHPNCKHGHSRTALRQCPPARRRRQPAARPTHLMTISYDVTMTSNLPGWMCSALMASCASQGRAWRQHVWVKKEQEGARLLLVCGCSSCSSCARMPTHAQQPHGASTQPHPLLLVADELDDLDAGAEAPELVAPVGQRGLGHHDLRSSVRMRWSGGAARCAGAGTNTGTPCACEQPRAAAAGPHHVVAVDAAVLAQVGHKRDGLQRLAQPLRAHGSRAGQEAGARASSRHERGARAPASLPPAHHLVCQDAVDAVVVQVDEPVHALHLVLPERAAGDDGGLHLQAVPAPAVLLVAQQLRVLVVLVAAGQPAAALPARGGEPQTSRVVQGARTPPPPCTRRPAQ